ncbi:MAG: PAS domain S-box protein, partial [Anaerolineaceae bacterium]|nr:PAS domain S-box protein [Anaerolineaceae bacterium]
LIILALYIATRFNTFPAIYKITVIASSLSIFHISLIHTLGPTPFSVGSLVYLVIPIWLASYFIHPKFAIGLTVFDLIFTTIPSILVNDLHFIDILHPLTVIAIGGGSAVLFSLMRNDVELLRKGALQEEKERYQKVIDVVYGGMVMMTRDNNQIIVDANQAAGEILGIDHQKLVGLSARSLFDSEHKFLQAFGNILHRDFVQIWVEFSEGDRICLEIITIPSRHNDEDVLVFAFRDVTQEVVARDKLQADRMKLAEQVDEQNRDLGQLNRELERALSSKDQFLASLNLNLHSPINSILGLSALLQDGYLGEISPQQSRYLKMIHENSEQLSNLINNLLILSGLEEIIHRNQLISVHELCEQTQTWLAAQTTDNPLNIEWHCGAGDVELEGDPDSILQILRALLAKAISLAAPWGNLEVTCRVDHAASSLIFRICYQGDPLSESDIEHFFDLVQNESTFDHGRMILETSLSLAVARRLTTAMRGEIVVSTSEQEDEGGCFLLTLPVNQDGIS